MKFRLVVVGKVRDEGVGAAVAMYEARVARYWPFVVHEVREEGAARDPAIVRAREGERLLARAEGAMLVACDERGTSMTSDRFATWMQGAREAARDVALLIGGAHGLDTAVRDRADLVLSLAPWTLPHEMARLVLVEQMYRAGTIVRREPYHK